MRKPIALRKCSASTAVFCTSLLYTADATMGVNGTALPRSLAMAMASAVLPVPGPPVSSTARPASLVARTKSVMIPHASRAAICPTRPQLLGCVVLVASTSPTSFKPRPVTCVCAATRGVVLDPSAAVAVLLLLAMVPREWFGTAGQVPRTRSTILS